jgi:hypothetical protein
MKDETLTILHTKETCDGLQPALCPQSMQSTIATEHSVDYVIIHSTAVQLVVANVVATWTCRLRHLYTSSCYDFINDDSRLR